MWFVKQKQKKFDIRREKGKNLPVLGIEHTTFRLLVTALPRRHLIIHEFVDLAKCIFDSDKKESYLFYFLLFLTNGDCLKYCFKQQKQQTVVVETETDCFKVLSIHETTG